MKRRGWLTDVQKNGKSYTAKFVPLEGDPFRVWGFSGQEGLYDVNVTGKSIFRRGRRTKIKIVEDATLAFPESEAQVRALLRGVTGFADRILDGGVELSQGPERILETIKDEKYLTSIKGIGSKYAKDILSKLEGVEAGVAPLAKAISSWGLPWNPSALRCQWLQALSAEEPRLAKWIELDPYLLTRSAQANAEEVDRAKENARPVAFAFKTVDEAALEVCPKMKNSLGRFKSSFSKILSDTASQGSTAISLASAASALKKMDMTKVGNVAVSEKSIPVLTEEAPGAQIVTYQTPGGKKAKAVSTRRLINKAETIREAIFRLEGMDSPVSEEKGRQLYRKTVAEAPVTLTREQKQALRLGLSRNVSGVVGEAGTGKTLAFSLLAEALSSARDVRLTSPTGAGAQRLSENIDMEAQTLHSFLGYNGFRWELPEPRDVTIKVDEFGMASMDPMYYLSRYVLKCIEADKHPQLTFCGDPNQLPPVGKGFPMRDITSGHLGSAVGISKLSRVQRQDAGPISEVGPNVLRGYYPIRHEGRLSSSGTVYWYESHASAWEELSQTAQWLGTTPSNVTYVTPLRNPSSVEDAIHLRRDNPLLQKRFASERGEKLHSHLAQSDTGSQWQKRFAKGDQVVHRGKNGYQGVMRSTTGEVVEAEKKVVVQYPTKKATYSTPEEIAGLGLAYLRTAHIFQGQEADYVCVSIPDRAGHPLKTREWLYTALTRAKKGLVLFASRQSIDRCLSTSESDRRHTLLATRFQS